MSTRLRLIRVPGLFEQFQNFANVVIDVDWLTGISDQEFEVTAIPLRKREHRACCTSPRTIPKSAQILRVNEVRIDREHSRSMSNEKA